ncbi:MAG: hypothetical protein JO270_00985 [Acidobacteriaceae bacterium]|nr:hypothetical protein [Acidobacteriaceae bacterium]MBV8573229.1 hypothetical protein [Acidobacteriaceae bacterium]
MPRIVIFLLFSLVSVNGANTSDPVFAPLWLYNGSWEVSRQGSAKPDQLTNECALIGNYFACQQTVNGTPSELLIFVPSKTPGKYFTQSVNPDGRAGGRGDLEISGDKWVYSSTWDAGGRTVYYRTTNLFTGKDRIHFEQAESGNNRDWTVKMTGDEVRASKRAAKASR